MKQDHRKLGVLQILMSGICFGFLGIFAKLAFAQGIGTTELLSLRYLAGGFILVIYFLFTNAKHLLITRKEILYCFFLGTAGYALFSSLYFLALKDLSASLSVLLLYTYPVLVAAGGVIFLKEKIPPKRWYAIPLAFTGMVLLVGSDFQLTHLSGFIFGLGSALFYAIYILVSRKVLENTNPVVAVAYVQCFAGMALATLSWQDPYKLVQTIRIGWPIILGLAFIGSVLAMALFQAGLKKLKGWEASVLSMAEPITGVTIALLFLGEKLSIWQIAGGLAILVALTAVSIPAKK